MAARPLQKQRSVKKRTAKFLRFAFDKYPGRLKATWRRPRGIDSRIRRQFRGNKPLVSIGYGSNSNTRYSYLLLLPALLSAPSSSVWADPEQLFRDFRGLLDGRVISFRFIDLLLDSSIQTVSRDSSSPTSLTWSSS
jgi:hypothetical protein